MPKNRLPSLKPKRVLQALQRAGFYIARTSGSHYLLKHSHKKTSTVIVPHHNKDLKRGTLMSIVDQTGLTTEEFLKLL